MERRAKPRGKYLAAIKEFAETEDCWPVELVASHPSMEEIASQFGKTLDQVLKDINRMYVESCDRPRG
jgi:hypothetical protein